MRGKKGGIGEHVLELIPLLFVLTFVGLALFVLINKQINQSIESFPIESDVFFQRVMYAKGVISYEDPASGNVVSGVIDYERWKSHPDILKAKLEQEIAYTHPISAKIIINSSSKENLTLYYHQADHEKATVFHTAGVGGIGSVYFDTKRVPVILRTSAGIEQALLTVEIALPRSI
jgi:hypothetical protein